MVFCKKKQNKMKSQDSKKKRILEGKLFFYYEACKKQIYSKVSFVKLSFFF